MLSVIVPAVFFLFILYVFWHARDVPDVFVYHNGTSNVVKEIIRRCTCFNEKYVPVYIWGKSGHLQSIIFTILGRVGKVPYCPSKRVHLHAKDGSLVSYDVFGDLSSYASATIVVVPGICNHSENKYMQVFAQYISSHGYRVAVLNHTGALKDVRLTAPRIFSYGHTDDLELVVNDLLQSEGVGRLVAIGFSLGANILMKYLGEHPDRQKHFAFAASLCQGYDIPECSVLMQDWQNLRKMYNFCLTRNMLKVIHRHKETFTRYTHSQNIALDWNGISSSTALHELDMQFTSKVYKEEMDRYYRTCSSSTYMQNISIPMLVLNTADDPIIPHSLFKYPRTLCDKNENVIFVVPPFGGHLGFFERGWLIPDRLSWLDRMLLEYIQVSLEVIQ